MKCTKKMINELDPVYPKFCNHFEPRAELKFSPAEKAKPPAQPKARIVPEAPKPEPQAPPETMDEKDKKIAELEAQIRAMRLESQKTEIEKFLEHNLGKMTKAVRDNQFTLYRGKDGSEQVITSFHIQKMKELSMISKQPREVKMQKMVWYFKPEIVELVNKMSATKDGGK